MVVDLEKALLKIMSKEELEKSIEEKKKEFQGILTRENAVKLLAKERGLLGQNSRFVKIKDIKDRDKGINVDARIVRVFDTVEFSTGTKVRKVKISDGTGVIVLSLWNDDIEFLKRAKANDEIRIKNAYVKNGELHLSYSGTVELVKKAPFTPLDDLKEGVPLNIRALVKSVEGVDRFVVGGWTRTGFAFTITNGETEVPVIIWKKIERGKALEEGDEVVIENAKFINGRISVFLDGRILVKKKKTIAGRIKKFEILSYKDKGSSGNEEREGMMVEIDGKKVELSREDVLELLGIEAAEDIELKTIAELKKNQIVGKNFVIMKYRRVEKIVESNEKKQSEKLGD